MNIHLIAIGGAAMHNIAIALYRNHHTVTGSDDEIYEPSKSRLQKLGLLPAKIGWFPSKITKNLDFIILGMHARKDNPELLKAQKLGIPVLSYPEYIYEHSKDKKRVVVAGSHGKTTTTSMIMHILKFHHIDFDYLVGAQLEGFENMVYLSDAPIMVIEGDEYLSSPIDRRPKFLHYKPDIAIITGVAWDHMNVFPTFENYKAQFETFILDMEKGSQLFYYKNDPHLKEIISAKKHKTKTKQYSKFKSKTKDNRVYLSYKDKDIPLEIFGKHNLENLKAAYLVCKSLEITDEQFYEAVVSFKGASKRLQLLNATTTSTIYKDFAHAPSKVQATINAVKELYPKRSLLACLELHTYSSLNKKFLHQYKHTMNKADEAFVYFSEHTLAMKKLPKITKKDIQKYFDHPYLKVLSDKDDLAALINKNYKGQSNLLFMSSGTFGGMDLGQFAQAKTNQKKMKEGKKISDSKTIMTEMIMPNDTNPIGNLMGGNLLRWMDIVGGICAGKHCEAYVVTASVDNVSFQKPIHLGDVITIEACVTRAFNTSVEIYVEVFASNIKGKNNRLSNHAYFTFVAIDDAHKKPIKVNPVIPLTQEEQKRFDGALRRRQLRLILAGRMKPEEATEIKLLFTEN